MTQNPTPMDNNKEPLNDAVLYPDSLPGGMPKLDEPIISEKEFNDALATIQDESPYFQKPKLWIKEIESYCSQQGITPMQLIEFHRAHCANNQ